MWKLYARERDGVAIKTDFESLKRCFEVRQPVYVGKIEYVNFGRAFIDPSNAFNSFVTKRVEFAHEREVRAVISEIPVRNGSVDFTDVREDAGMYIDVDLGRLVKEVVIAPYAEDWFVDLIRSVSAKYNIDAPIKRSSLSKEPTWA